MTEPMTPYEIEILLHYYYSAVDHPSMAEAGSNAWAVNRDRLKEKDLLMCRDSGGRGPVYKLTERGDYYVREGLLKVPLPVQRWEIPAIAAELEALAGTTPHV